MILSDTHTRDPVPQDSSDAGRYGFVEPLPAADVLLHCGDLTMVGLLSEFDGVIAMLGKIEAELKLVIAGNHDCSLDAEYYSREGRDQHGLHYEEDVPVKAREMWTGIRAREAGITYLDEGTHQFTLQSGASFTIYASPYQPEFCNWAFPYEKNEDRFNPADRSFVDAINIAEHPIMGSPDIVMTHGPAYDCLDRQYEGLRVGCPHLSRALMRTRPLLHCCGHIHEAHGASIIQWGPDADDRAASEETIDAWKDAGLARSTITKADSAYADDRQARTPVMLDYSSAGRHPLERQKETLMINASIVDIRYRPTYAPYVVDLDLSR
jgi:hypothetical protein